MSNHPIQSQDVVPRGSRRLQFRPLGWGNELSPRDNPDQATLEAPIATPQLMRNRGEFLVATTELPVQDQGGQNGDGYQANHNGHPDREHDVRDRPTIVTQVQPRQFAPAAWRRKEIALLDTLTPLPPADLDASLIAAIGDGVDTRRLGAIDDDP